jgi:hypothetical protein
MGHIVAIGEDNQLRYITVTPGGGGHRGAEPGWAQHIARATD